jgi:hypothetical protein
MRQFIFRIINLIFHYTIYNWNPSWYQVSNQLYNKINNETLSKVNLTELIRSIILNPFSSEVPYLLRNIKGLNWKAMNALSLTIFKIIVSIQILISTLIYLGTFGLLLWGPVRMLFSMGFLNMILQVGFFENIYLYGEKLFSNLINLLYNYFLPNKPNFLGMTKPNVLIDVPNSVRNVTASDIYNALKPLEGINKFYLPNLLGSKHSFLSNEMLDMIYNPIDTVWFLAKWSLIIGFSLGCGVLLYNNSEIVTEYASWGLSNLWSGIKWTYNGLKATTIGTYIYYFPGPSEGADIILGAPGGSPHNGIIDLPGQPNPPPVYENPGPINL